LHILNLHTNVTLLFVQLYEMSDDVKRKEFLDELFTFMQKRGELATCDSAIESCDSEIFSENCT